MTEFAIRTNGVSKRYRYTANEGQKSNRKLLSETLVSTVKWPLRRLRGIPESSGTANTFWALQDVTFEVRRGEALGIIGRNGAGKSTLLKILSRITKPTKGTAEVFGRVGALLEVGTGFHQELTGRENIYLNGAILGMQRSEITRKLDEIIAFAEVEKFIDTPIKHYSSGMHARLAFSVAAHLEPEILLVDEVLAVGDAAFQKKCLGKMSASADEGRTILFVSHNMSAMQNLCRRAIWLQEGRIKGDGAANHVISDYLSTASVTSTERIWADIATAPGNDKVRLRRVAVRPENGDSQEKLTVRTPIIMEFEYWNLRSDTYLSLSIHVYNEEGIEVFNTFSFQEPHWHGRPFPLGLFRSMCYVPGDFLNDGRYHVLVALVENEQVNILRQRDTLEFEVLDSSDLRGSWYGKWEGVVRPNLRWTTDLMETMKSSTREAS